MPSCSRTEQSRIANSQVPSEAKRSRLVQNEEAEGDEQVRRDTNAVAADQCSQLRVTDQPFGSQTPQRCHCAEDERDHNKIETRLCRKERRVDADVVAAVCDGDRSDGLDSNTSAGIERRSACDCFGFEFDL